MKICKLLVVLLALTLLLCACADTQNQPQNTTETVTQAEERVPQSPVGIWYSETDGYAVQIHSVTSATYYKIKSGYYRYTETADVTCDDMTVSDLQFTLASGTAVTLRYDSVEGKLTNPSTGNAYTKQDALPQLYHAFPNYEALDLGALVTLNGLDALTYPVDAKSMAARDIFDEVYANETNLPTLTDRQTAQQGDYVNIDYAGYLDGVAFSGGTATNQKILIVSESGYIPGFAEGILGHTVGESFSVPVTFPEDYGSADLAGKSVVFEMKLNAIYDMEFSDETIKSFTKNEYETYAAYLAELEKETASELLWNTVLENATFSELPEETYLYFYQYFSDPYREYAKQYGMEYESFLNLMVGISDLYIRNYAKSYAKTYILTYAIAEQNELTVSQEDLQAEIDEITEELLAQGYTAEEITTYFDDEQKRVLETQLLRDKIFEWIFSGVESDDIDETGYSTENAPTTEEDGVKVEQEAEDGGWGELIPVD